MPGKPTDDASGRISGLLFKTPVLKEKDAAAALEAFKALPGKVSVLVEADSKSKLDLDADARLAVGSAFKLAVLATLKKQIDARERAWSDVVILREAWKSLPSGVPQTWPDGMPLTLASVAALMISRSDNTAADLVLRTVGRAAVEVESAQNVPFLTTREAFQLKDPANASSLAVWRSGDKEARGKVLQALSAMPLPNAKVRWADVVATDVEWFFSVRELCSLMREVAILPLTNINPGVADAALWGRVSFKGGSESGVLNLTTQVTSRAGASYCVSATWNDTRLLDESKFELLYGSLLGSLNQPLLASRKSPGRKSAYNPVNSGSNRWRPQSELPERPFLSRP